MSDSDEYDDYDLSEFTQDDFARIDAAIESVYLETIGNKGRPAIPIQIEQPVLSPTSPTPDIPRHRSAESSPFQRYRRYKILSVTDLVSPAWYVPKYGTPTNDATRPLKV
jgi:hypothetical protein